MDEKDSDLNNSKKCVLHHHRDSVSECDNNSYGSYSSLDLSIIDAYKVWNSWIKSRKYVVLIQNIFFCWFQTDPDDDDDGSDSEFDIPVSNR